MALLGSPSERHRGAVQVRPVNGAARRPRARARDGGGW
jgi:hypothetical protein